jgi:hypothetical protein
MPYDSPEEALARRRIRIEEKRMLAEEKKKRAALRKAMKRAEDAAAVAMLHDDRRVYSGMDVYAFEGMLNDLCNGCG